MKKLQKNNKKIANQSNRNKMEGTRKFKECQNFIRIIEGSHFWGVKSFGWPKVLRGQNLV